MREGLVNKKWVEIHSVFGKLQLESDEHTDETYAGDYPNIYVVETDKGISLADEIRERQ